MRNAGLLETPELETANATPTPYPIAPSAPSGLALPRALVLACSGLAYLVGTAFEEKDLVRTFGETCRRYTTRVPAFVPVPWKRLRDPRELVD